MKLSKLISVVALIIYVPITLAQVSNVVDIKPLEGVAIPKTQPSTELKPGATFKDCSECPEMVMIPAGSFMMGSADGDSTGENTERPQHLVQIQSFAIGKYEVTQEEWDSVMGSNLSANKGRTLPVTNVPSSHALKFVQRLSQTTGKNYRLPSEAEWEYAARGGSITVYPWGDSVTDLPAHAWIIENSSSSNSVGLKNPNQFGLYDMLGNVMEWTQDCWNKNYSGAPADGSAWTSGDCSQRVVRGGSWYSNSRKVRSTFRYGNLAEARIFTIGFRVARSN